MRSLKKYFLMMLAFLPIGSIAVVAKSAELDIKGEEQKEILLDQLRKSRQLLMPNDVYSTTIPEARSRLQSMTKIQDELELSNELEKHLNLLQKNGILIRDENQIVSGSPECWRKT